MSETLALKFENSESRLGLQFMRGDGRTMDASERIHQGVLDLSFSFYCFGYDLAEFAKELESFHSRFEGNATFENQTGEVKLDFSLAHPARGIIGIVVTLSQWIAWPADWAPLRQQAEQRSRVFAGFSMEQSNLPSTVAQIRQFLVDSDISTIHPAIHKLSS
jgi:hypothetical protein